MKKYEVKLITGEAIEINAECYNTDEENNLDMIMLDGEGLEEYIGTFKDWSYVRIIE